MNSSASNRLVFQDGFLILAMAVLAACGLIYEYLLSLYAGRVLGVMESTIYAMIGIMIVAMGLGAFAARKVSCPFNGFVYLELIIAFLGASSIFIIGALVAATQQLPQLLADTFSLPPEVLPRGGAFKSLAAAALNSPYLFGLLLGFFIGMEIPLIAKIREHIYQRHLANNLGTIYGADYIGAGVGAAIWVIYLLSIDINQAAALTAMLNLVIGAFFIWSYKDKLKHPKLLVLGHILVAICLVFFYKQGANWLHNLSNTLYLDKVVYSEKTRYQQITITERKLGLEQDSIISLYLNGRLQFSSADEQIYHSYLVTPTLAGSARQENILIVGGGDGLALRDVLTWQPKQVTLIDLDKQLVDLFKQPNDNLSARISERLLSLNDDSLSDERVTLIHQDAFIAVDDLLKSTQVFDAIIVDLPDPSHPDLNKLYSVHFYAKLNQLLASDGLISVQSTSPYHAKKAFLSIGKTMQASGYSSVEQYHDNVPSFGEWGWTIAAKSGQAPSVRLMALQEFQVEQHWLTLPMLLGSFAFSENFYAPLPDIPVNHLGSHVIYQLHQEAWQKQQGLNNAYNH